MLELPAVSPNPQPDRNPSVVVAEESYFVFSLICSPLMASLFASAEVLLFVLI